MKADYWVKERKVDHPVHRLIHERWSPVVFSDQAVEEEKLATLWEAVRWAPSCYNDQPWHLVVGVKGEESWEKVFGCLVEANQFWAQHAPVLGIAVARLAFEKTGKPNRHAIYDLGLGMGHMVLQAVDLELSVHQMAGFDPAKAREVLEIPQGYEPMTAFAVGYMANPRECENDKLRQRELTVGTRKPQSQFVFSGAWGHTL